MRGILATINGKPCVKYESVHSGEAKVTTLYWPVYEVIGDYYGNYVPKDGNVLENSWGDVWTATDAKTFKVTGSVKTIANAQPIHSTCEAVPCPKVRAGIQTRWHDGRWQKLLKKGWVSAQ